LRSFESGDVIKIDQLRIWMDIHTGLILM